MILRHRRKRLRLNGFQNATEIAGTGFNYATHGGKL